VSVVVSVVVVIVIAVLLVLVLNEVLTVFLTILTRILDVFAAVVVDVDPALVGHVVQSSHDSVASSAGPVEASSV
jgi:hypothetical protein